MKKNIVIIFVLLLSVLAYTQRYGESDDFSYALKLYNEGFFDIAAQQFSIFVNRYPASDRLPEARYYLGLSYYRSNDFEDARREFQLMAVTYPEHTRAPEAWQKVGESYLQLGRKEEAARAFETVKILYPTDPLAPVCLFQAAKIYYEEKMNDKAIMALRDFLDRYPDSNKYPNGRLLFAMLQLEENNYDIALQEFDKVLKSGAENDLLAEAHLGMGEFYSRLGQLESAREQFQIILSKYSASPVSFEALLRLSELMTLYGEYDNALKIVNDNLIRYKTSPQKSSLSLQQAAVYLIREDYFSARKVLEGITTAGLNDSLQARLYFYLGVACLGDGKYDQSVSNLNRLLSDSLLKYAGRKYVPEAKKQLGYAHLRMKEYERSSGILHEYISEKKENSDAEEILSDLFYAALDLKRAEEAENLYREILTIAPHYSFRDNLLYDLSTYYFNTQKYAEAKSAFLRFANRYPCSGKIDSVQIFLDHISTYHITDQKAGMNRLARLMGQLVIQDKKMELMLELARVHLNYLKDIPTAIEYAQHLVSSSTDSGIVGDAYHVMGESYRRDAEMKKFQGEVYTVEKQKALNSFRNAMNYVAHVQYPDSLAFSFLSMISEPDFEEPVPMDKQIQFLQQFRRSYPESRFAEKAAYRMAKLYYDKKDIDNAIMVLQDLLESENTYLRGNAYYFLGKIHYEMQNQSNAAELFKEFLLNISIHPLRAAAFGTLAKINENMGDFSTAAQFWSKLIEEYDYSPAALAAKNRIPEIYLKAEDFAQVLKYTGPYLRKTMAADLVLRKLRKIEEPEFTFFAGKAYFNMNDRMKSRNLLLDYIFTQPDGEYYAEAHFILADISLSEGDTDAALSYLQTITRNNSSPFYLQAAARSADIYFERKQYEKAGDLYESLIPLTTDPDQKIRFQAGELISFINLGNLKQYDRKVSSFRDQFKKHKEYDKYSAAFEYEIGKYYYRNKNFDAAIKRFETVAGKYKRTEYADDAEYQLGLTYTTLNKVEKAMDILSKFSEKHPESDLKADIYVTLGGLYYRAEKRELAVGAFQRAVELANSPATRKSALSNLILIYRDLGLWDGVLSETRKYVQEFPEAEDIIDKKIMMGSAMIYMNRYSEAVEFLRNLKFEANSEQEPEIQFYIGEAYFNGGQYENAIREFVKIPLLSKQTKLQWEASALYYSGQAYEKLGRKSDAIRMYQEIVDRPGILADLKREAQKRIEQLKES